MDNNQNWTTIITSKPRFFDLKLKECWKYRDLITMFVKRNFVMFYKQTILGPLWYVIQPLFSTVVFTIVFGNIAKIPTDGAPTFLFYMAGNIMWSYFSSCLNQTSSTFTSNSSVFGKVYFPRLTTPISIVITNMINLGVQFVLFLGFFLYYLIASPGTLSPNLWILSTPLLVLQMAILGLGFGIIVSSMTTKYRDLTLLVTFGVQLWMYATPVVYPVSTLSDKARDLIMLNPMSPIIETFKYAFLGTGEVPIFYLGVSWIFTFAVLFLGTLMFNRVEKTFMDTV